MEYHKIINMKIEKTIIPLDIADFTVGQICVWRGTMYLFDIDKIEMLQISSSGEIGPRVHLRENGDIKQISAVYFSESFLLLADSMGQNLYRFEFDLYRSGLTLEKKETHPLPPGMEIVSILTAGDEYFILDKGNSMLRVYDPNFQEIKTIGSRMGYILEYEDEQNLRLGFEFPEDLAVSDDGKQILVSDTGNKRLVLLNLDGKQEKIVRLPEFPFKIIVWDESGDRVFVTDFDSSVMVVSIEYGHIATININYPVDFFPSVFQSSRQVVVSENHLELVELTFEDTTVEAIAREACNHHVLVKILADESRQNEAIDLVKANMDLLPDYAAISGDMDDFMLTGLNNYVQETFQKLLGENELLAKKVSKLSVDFIKKYKSIPEAEDSEASHIDKEIIRHRMFSNLKQYRRNLKEIGDLKRVTSSYPNQRKRLSDLFEKRFEFFKLALLKTIEDIELYLEPFSELEILDTIVRYWWMTEEFQVLFVDRKLDFKRFFGGKFLLAILNDFYFNIGELYRVKHKIEKYIAFCDREITMYTDKSAIFRQFILQLIQWQHFSDVLRMLKKIPDQNREDLNYYYYLVNLAKGNMDAAFEHLKKELDLYPHRVNLIPKLIELDRLESDKEQLYIDKLLEKSSNTIDTYLHVAKSFYNTGNLKKAEFYLDRELELFPENKTALALKMEMVLHHDPAAQNSTYYLKTLEIFSRFIRINSDENTARQLLPLFTVLNFLPVTADTTSTIVNIQNNITFGIYKQELEIYLSFLTQFYNTNIGRAIEPYEYDTYLTAYSTSRLSYEVLFHRLEEKKNLKEWSEMFELAENLLKYHPGDEKIFRFLDEINEAGQ